jgi:hypothetical protein
MGSPQTSLKSRVEEGHDGSEQVVLRPVAQSGFFHRTDEVDHQVPAFQVLNEVAAGIGGHQHSQRTLVGKVRLVRSVEFHFLQVLADCRFQRDLALRTFVLDHG